MINPVVSTCATAPDPIRVNAACSSRKSIATSTARRCACSIWRASARGANAHTTDTDFTGVKVRS